MLDHLIGQWGYLVLLLGTMLEGESILIAAGAMAHKGLFHINWVMAVAAIGGFLGDVIWYVVGRKIGWPFIQKRPKFAAKTEALKAYSERFGGLFVIAIRFTYGFRTAAPIFLGATRFPAGKFLAFNALGAIIWSLLISQIGYQLGAGAKAVLARHPHAEEILLATIIGIIVFMLVRHGIAHLRSRISRENQP